MESSSFSVGFIAVVLERVTPGSLRRF